ANTDEIPKGAITASEDTKQLVKDIEEVTKKDLNGDGIIGEKEE
ncbi:diacylglycerol kinase, partial [Lactobacillus salivarius]|nr:diacylglycerol kinase [Ligilactobacillus salivarius]